MLRFSLSLVCMILSVEPDTVSRYSLQTQVLFPDRQLRRLSLYLVAERPRQAVPTAEPVSI